jgi:hypothetical protein
VTLCLIQSFRPSSISQNSVLLDKDKKVPFLHFLTFCSLSTKKVRLILHLNSGHKQPIDGELIVVYVRMRLKVGSKEGDEI